MTSEETGQPEPNWPVKTQLLSQAAAIPAPQAMEQAAASGRAHLVGVEPALDAHARLVLGEHLLHQDRAGCRCG